MASINARKETSKLYFDFSYRNVRCREQTDLSDTPTNRRRLQTMLNKIQAEILLGCFDYAKTFPNSRMVQKIESTLQAVNESTVIPSFSEFAEIWFSELEVQWRKSYKITVHNVVFNRLIPKFGPCFVNAITKAQLLSFRSELANYKKKNGALLSPSHVNRNMKIMRMILAEAADRFEFTTTFKSIKPLKIPKSDIQPFTPDEIGLILNNVREDYKSYFTVRFFTGMRTGEADGLKWRYVDFEKRTISIRETIVGGELTYTKNDFSQRDIQMSEPVYVALRDMQLRTQQHEFVFVNATGNPLDHNAVTKRVWYPLLKNLGINKRNPYQMRHTAATLWLASGESPEWIANQMGHSNTEMLFRVYSRYVPNLTRQDGTAADKMFSNLMGDGTNGPFSTSK